MKRNYSIATAACFLIAAFFIFTSNHVRVEHSLSPDYSKEITQRFHWEKDEPALKTPKLDRNFFSHFPR